VPPKPTIVPVAQPVLNPAVQHVVAQAQEQEALVEEDINKMNISQLKEELRKWKKSTTCV
jgi:hypothetical protein